MHPAIRLSTEEIADNLAGQRHPNVHFHPTPGFDPQFMISECLVMQRHPYSYMNNPRDEESIHNMGMGCRDLTTHVLKYMEADSRK
jgi:hypothetical protein